MKRTAPSFVVAAALALDCDQRAPPSPARPSETARPQPAATPSAADESLEGDSARSADALVARIREVEQKAAEDSRLKEIVVNCTNRRGIVQNDFCGTGSSAPVYGRAGGVASLDFVSVEFDRRLANGERERFGYTAHPSALHSGSVSRELAPRLTDPRPPIRAWCSVERAIRAAEARGFDTSKWFRASLNTLDGEWWFRSDNGAGVRLKDPCMKTDSR